MSTGRRIAGFLVIPGFLAVLALVGMGLSSESREDFEERNETEESAQDQTEQQQQQNDQGQPQDFFDPDGNPQPGNGEQSDQGEQGDETNGDSGDSGQDQRQPVTIRTENGELVIEFDENGQPTRVGDGDAFIPGDPGRTLAPNEDGDLVGFRVGDDGTLDPVASDDIQSGDFLLRPAQEGIDIERPDGSRVNLTPTEGGELEATEIQPDGSRELIPADEGDVILQPGSQLDPEIQVDDGTDPLVIETADGPVRLDLAGNGDLVADQPAGENIDIDPDDLSAIRVGEGGTLELVPLDEIQPDDTVLVPNEDGFDLQRPDGSTVEFRPDRENDGITATEVSPDGTEVELTPNPDGSVTLSDGTTVGPIDQAEDGGTFEQIVDRASDLPWPWVFGGIAALALLSIGTALYLHKNRPDDHLFDFEEYATTGVPEEQLEKFLAVLSADPDPNRAIRLAFHAAERGLGGVPPRRADETPFEWHARVEQVRPQLGEPLAPICDLFARARFAPGTANEADQNLMIGHLRRLNQVANDSASEMAGV